MSFAQKYNSDKNLEYVKRATKIYFFLVYGYIVTRK